MTSRVPSAIRAFHFPGARASFAAGTLQVAGIGSLLFPKSPVRVVVRSRPLAADKVGWLRCFGGKKYVASVYSRSMPLENPDAPQPLHDVEDVFPLRFHLDWGGSSAFNPSPGGGVLSPAHVNTTLLATSIALPKSLPLLRLSIAMHEDGGGWDLHMVVSALRLPLLSFSGPMRLLPDVHDGGSGARFVEGFHHVVMFDGHCNLCNASVDFISRNDPQFLFLFVAQQSPKAAALLHRLAINRPSLLQASLPSAAQEGNQDSVLLITPDGCLHQRASAALRCGAALAWPWSWLARAGLAAAAVLPDAAVDAAYNYIARNRYKWFGRRETCRVATAAERARFM